MKRIVDSNVPPLQALAVRQNVCPNCYEPLRAHRGNRLCRNCDSLWRLDGSALESGVDEDLGRLTPSAEAILAGLEQLIEVVSFATQTPSAAALYAALNHLAYLWSVGAEEAAEQALRQALELVRRQGLVPSET
jgi:hypothetical protein